MDPNKPTQTNDPPAPPAVDPAAPPAPPPPLAERIPEKYRVFKEDKSLDQDASIEKMLEGHIELQKRFGAGDVPPKTPDEYAPEVPEGIDFEELKADPAYQSFLKGAHGKGMTNAQLSWVLEEYTKRASEQVGNAPMTVEQFRTEVEPHFAAIGGYNKGIELGIKAVKAFVPEATAADIASLPNHPLVARVLAAVGKEVGEDTPILAGTPIASDWEAEVAKIRASDAYNQGNHPEHKQAIDRMNELFAKRYGAKAQKLGASAVIQAG